MEKKRVGVVCRSGGSQDLKNTYLKNTYILPGTYCQGKNAGTLLMRTNHPADTKPLLDVHRYRGAAEGPRLLVLGGVHGNEPGTSSAVKDILSLLINNELQITAGELVLVSEVNKKACLLGQRYVDRDLNRNMGRTDTPKLYEDYIANSLCPLLEEADILLDLHSYSAGDFPFILLGPPNKKERKFAQALGIHSFCWGIGDVIARASGASTELGTTEYLRLYGGYGITLECGRKYDKEATAAVGRISILRALHYLSLIESLPNPSVLKSGTADQPIKGGKDRDNRWQEGPGQESAERCVSDKVQIPAQRFIRATHVFIKEREGQLTRGWQHLDPVKKQDTIAYYDDGIPVNAPTDGFILLPHREAEVNSNWFYLGREEAP